jgi:hypothetical protein
MPNQYPQELDELLDFVREPDVQRAYVDSVNFTKYASSQIAYHMMLGQFDAAALMINVIFALGYRLGKDGLLDKDVWASAIDEAFMKESE